ncbi:MAG: cyclic nucleotide-binding domain-containing protein [Candidatus Bipolaricaulota bacterium]|nr:cyclic nucleotide-binding domain-containing protein [Candidatus Bipolaricaulota bacterium]MCS7274748.1 cyclic nucleotide-binding domain-containing protein [Candidatus Bipolaricaulota bacterium]MDW8110028.1 cyclic nucleotide-binding domain-containing protein [Candidatus Bipolaricaulota bacterium]MDW8328900.1 cyclic nucleotide-binding domain-containing protein [Candidatus Bipolaricaulota bacterium]
MLSHREHLKDHQLLRQFSEKEIEELLQMGEMVSLRAGETLFAEGASDPHLYLVLEGEVEIRKTYGSNGEVHLLTVLGPGELLGEMGWVLERPRKVTATAKTDLLVFKIDGALLRERYQQGSQAAMRLIYLMLGALARKLTHMNDELLKVLERKSPPSELAALRERLIRDWSF